MPGRKTPLVNNEFYHVFNKGVASLPTFTNDKECLRAIETMDYYRNSTIPLKFTKFFNLPFKEKSKILNKLDDQSNRLVEIASFCFMPNHFHFLLKQLVDGGISKFVSNFTNSYTRYFNTKNRRTGHLFQGKFKSVRIESEEQLVHVSRYIHLNPYTANIVENLKALEKYPYSSFPEYISIDSSKIADKEVILSNFKDKLAYKNFVFDNSDYQRELAIIKDHLLE